MLSRCISVKGVRVGAQRYNMYYVYIEYSKPDNWTKERKTVNIGLGGRKFYISIYVWSRVVAASEIVEICTHFQSAE